MVTIWYPTSEDAVPGNNNLDSVYNLEVSEDELDHTGPTPLQH